MGIILGLLIITLVIIFRIFVISEWDRQRIREDAKRKGFNIGLIEWEPFGPGWIGEKGDRIYSVRIIEDNGITKSVYCKTSMLSGVYWK